PVYRLLLSPMTQPPSTPLFPYTTLFRSLHPRHRCQRLGKSQNRRSEDHRDNAARVDLERHMRGLAAHDAPADHAFGVLHGNAALDRKSTRLNSSHSQISYAVFCLKKKKN